LPERRRTLCERGWRCAVLVDEIGIDGDGSGGSFTGGRDDLEACVRNVARDRHAGDARQAVGAGDGPSVLIDVAAETDKQVAVRYETRRDEQRVAGDGAIGIELDAAEPAVLDEDLLGGSLGDRDSRAANWWRSAADSVPACAMYTRSSDHWPTICAYRTAAGEPPSTPSF
jgi:hypothetical protein